MKNKVFGFALLFLMSAAGVWAQNLPANLWSSPQSTITEGRYRSNADNFIRPDQYAGVSFNKWFGMVSFLADGNDAIATAGLAARVSKIYIGAFYSGNFWAGKPVNNYTEEEPATVPNGGTSGKVYDVYNSAPSVGGSTSVNNAAVLFGVADMGFRLTYRTNYQSFKESNIVTGGQLYNNYQTELGYIAPQIAWGMAKDLTKNGIRPYLTVDLVFDRNYQKTETAGPDGTVTTIDPDTGDIIVIGNTGEKIGNSSNHFDPALSLGLGGYTFLNKDGFRLSADLDYVLTLNLFNNEYSYVENNAYKTATFKGTYISGSPYLEQSFVSNLVTPSLSGQWGKDKLALRFKLNLPLTFSSEDKNAMILDSNNKLVYHGASITISKFIFRPDLRLALQYKIVPDKLTLNAGARIQATAITLDTTNEETYNNGTKTSARKIHNNSYINIGSGTQFISRFSIGPTFNFTENVWLEAATGVSNVFGDGVIDTFASGGPFTFGSILVALKF